MKCKKCGTQIPDNAKFCPKCGAPVLLDDDMDSSPENDYGDSVKPQKRRKFWIPIVIIVAAVVVVLIVLAATGVFTRKTVKLDNYVSVEFDGYEGQGTAEVSFDLTTLGEDYNQKIKLSNKAKDRGYDTFSEVVDHITKVSVNPKTDLSNGDEVTTDWSVNLNTFDEMVNTNVELSYEPETFKVTGLEKIETFDAFAGVNIEFSGVSPDATASISFDESDADVPEGVLDDLEFSLDKTDGLAIGDTVTVTISKNSAEMVKQDFGMIPEELSKDYVVEDVRYYVSSLDQIPEDGMEKLKNESEEVFLESIEDWSSYSLSRFDSMDYLGSYFLSKKPDIDTYHVNRIYLIYKIHATQFGKDEDGNATEEGISYYWFVNFNDGMILEDGTFSIDYSDHLTFSKSGSYRDMVTFTTRDYTQPAHREIVSRSYYGYEDLDTFYNKVILPQVDDYDCENTVEDQ